MKDYSFPVSQLLTLGEPAREFGKGRVYSRFQFTSAHIAELARMIGDMDLNTAYSDSSEVWAPLHAWRALAEIDPVAALDAMLSVHKAVLDEADSDWLAEDLLDVSSLAKGAALPALERYLDDASMGDARMYVAEAIGNIGAANSELREECVSILVRQLDRNAANSPTLNGGIIAGLCDLEAVDAVPVIERAFAAGDVDESIAGDWEVVQYELGLTEEPPEWRNSFSMPPAFGQVFQNPMARPKPKSQVRAKRKAQRQAKKKNRKKR